MQVPACKRQERRPVRTRHVPAGVLTEGVISVGHRWAQCLDSHEVHEPLVILLGGSSNDQLLRSRRKLRWRGRRSPCRCGSGLLSRCRRCGRHGRRSLRGHSAQGRTNRQNQHYRCKPAMRNRTQLGHGIPQCTTVLWPETEGAPGILIGCDLSKIQWEHGKALVSIGFPSSGMRSSGSDRQTKVLKSNKLVPMR
jgi:hypothetical protein